MDFGDVPAWVAAGVALVAAIIAVVAARYSRRQATAAEGQVALLSKQIEMAEQDRHEQNAPRFVITWSPTGDCYGEDGASFSIAYTSGPPRLDKVTVAVAPGSEAEGLALDGSERPEHLSIELTQMYAEVERKFIAVLNVHKDSGVVFLVSAESGTGSWTEQAVTAIDDY